MCFRPRRSHHGRHGHPTDRKAEAPGCSQGAISEPAKAGMWLGGPLPTPLRVATAGRTPFSAGLTPALQECPGIPRADSEHGSCFQTPGAQYLWAPFPPEVAHTGPHTLNQASLSRDTVRLLFHERCSVSSSRNQICGCPEIQPPSAWGFTVPASNAGLKYPHPSRKTLMIVSGIS